MNSLLSLNCGTLNSEQPYEFGFPLITNPLAWGSILQRKWVLELKSAKKPLNYQPCLSDGWLQTP